MSDKLFLTREGFIDELLKHCEVVSDAVVREGLPRYEKAPHDGGA